MGTELHLHALVLAGGAGRRFGGRKLSSPWNGGYLIDGALAAARAAPVQGVTVVTGADGAVEMIAQAAGAHTVYAPDHSLGLSASLRAGIDALPAHADGAYIFLGDMPRVPHNILAPLADALRAGALAAAPAFKGQRGHPVLLAKALFAQVRALQQDVGAGAMLKDLGDKLVLIETPDAGVLFDVDERT